MKIEKSIWTDGALMICTKCSSRVEKEGHKTWPSDWAESTKMAMKKDLKEKSLAKNLRVMTSSCLGLCPEGQQTVLLLEKYNESERAQMLVFNPEKTPQGLQEFSKEWLKKRGQQL